MNQNKIKKTEFNAKLFSAGTVDSQSLRLTIPKLTQEINNLEPKQIVKVTLEWEEVGADVRGN